MKITVVSATQLEVNPLVQFLSQVAESPKPFHFQWQGLQIHILITGVGMVATTYSLTKYLQHQSTGLLIHAGIAGSLKKSIAPGSVVQLTSEVFADIGVEFPSGEVQTVFEAGLADGNTSPFSNGQLINKKKGSFLKEVSGITVAKTTGSKDTLTLLKSKHPDAEIETMESASFFYVALQENLPFISIRGISNFVEERNKDNWKISEAVSSLNEVLVEMLKSLQPTSVNDRN